MDGWLAKTLLVPLAKGTLTRVNHYEFGVILYREEWKK